MLEVTGLIITYNERENITRTLRSLRWLPQIVVLDSFSTDETCEIARTFPNVRIEQCVFESFARQCNYGLTLIDSEWVLSFDADYVCPPELVSEIAQLKDNATITGYSVGFRYNVYGHALRSTLYPDRVVLYRRDLAHYEDEGHGHRVRVRGKVRTLKSKIDHDDRKPLSRWIVSQDQYARLEAHHLLMSNRATLSTQDRLRLGVFFAPPIIFCYLLFVRGLVVDGWRGWYYMMQRLISECLLSLRILTERHRLEEPGPSERPD